MRFRIATYNIHGGLGTDGVRDYQRIGEHLQQLGVDIALLQEVDARHTEHAPAANPELLCQRQEQQLIPAPAIVTRQGWYGNAILSRYPVVESESIDVSQLGFEPRNIQLATIVTHEKTLRVVNTHKGLKTAERRIQLARLHEQLQGITADSDLIILGGDFNEWQFFTRAFKAIDQLLTPVATGATFPSCWPVFKLDRLWLKAENFQHSAKVVRTPTARRHSDHCPVVVDIIQG